MADRADLLKSAVRLDVVIYDGKADCSAPTGTPAESKTYAASDTISLDVKPGEHTIILTAYSDSAGTNAIARACTTSNLKAGSQVCFDLVVDPVTPIDASGNDVGTHDMSTIDGTVVVVTDGGDDQSMPDDLMTPDDQAMPDDLMTPDDLMPSGDQKSPDDLFNGECHTDEECKAININKPKCTPGFKCVECLAPGDCSVANTTCCGNSCKSTHTNTDCGGCGNICGNQNTLTNSCATGACVITCKGTYHNCDGNPSNGCETDVSTSASNCSACGDVCSTATNNMGSTCGASTCSYTCSGGKFDCDKSTTAPNLDGCECDGDGASENVGATGCCSNGCQTKHSTGVGANYFDCQALATYNETEATRACNASASSCTSTTCKFSGSNVVCGVTGSGTSEKCICWMYASSDNTRVGHVLSTDGDDKACTCPQKTDPAWN